MKTILSSKAMEQLVFISYSSTDLSKLKAFERKLNETDFLKPLVIARNRESGSLITDKVTTGIKTADLIVPILTTNSIHAQWMNQEIGYAIALKKEVHPLVEHQVIGQLAGFITNAIDIPYQFNSNPDKKKERNAFRTCCDLLIQDLRTKWKPDSPSKQLSLSDVFSGEWRNDYQHHSGRNGSEIVQIKNGNEYYADNTLTFLLDNIYISDDLKIIKFRKTHIKDKHTALNELELIRQGVYAGKEENNKVMYSMVEGKTVWRRP